MKIQYALRNKGWKHVSHRSLLPTAGRRTLTTGNNTKWDLGLPENRIHLAFYFLDSDRGQRSVNGPFSIALLVYWRVIISFPTNIVMLIFASPCSEKAISFSPLGPRNTNRLKFGNDVTAQFNEETAVPSTVAAEKILESIREAWRNWWFRCHVSAFSARSVGRSLAVHAGCTHTHICIYIYE